MILVDADAHVMEPSGVWVERMDALHWGGLIPYYPGAGKAVRNLVAPLPAEQRAMIAGANAIDAYRLPRSGGA